MSLHVCNAPAVVPLLPNCTPSIVLKHLGSPLTSFTGIGCELQHGIPVLLLPLELQRETIGHLINHADFRALSLVSKHIEAIAASLLFHGIALNQYRGCIFCSFGHRKLTPLGSLTPMIKAISKSKNLCYVRTLRSQFRKTMMQ